MKLKVAGLTVLIGLILALLSGCFPIENVLNENSNSESTEYVVYSKTFYDINDWNIAGRQEGVNRWEIVNFKGLTSVHLHHESFTEIKLEKIIEFGEYNSTSDLIVEIKMAGKVQSSFGETSAFYSSAGVRIDLLDYSGNSVYNVAKIWSTSTYPLRYSNVEILELPQETWHTIVIRIPNGYVSESHFLKVSFYAYASGWPDDLIADLWVNSIKIYF